jgi:hypothetical protein
VGAIEPARSIWRVPPGGETNERLDVSDPGIHEIAVSFDDAHLVYSSDAIGDARGGAERDLWIVDLPAGTPRRLTSRPGSERSPCWSENGRFVYFLASKDEGAAPLIVFSVAIEGGEVAPVVPDFDRPVRELVSCPGSDKLFAVVIADSTSTLYRFHPKSHKAFALIEDVGDVSHLSPKSNGDKLSFVWRAPGASPEIATWSFPDDYVEQLPSNDANASGESDSPASHSDSEETNDG